MARRKTLGRKSSKSRNKKRKRTYRKTRRMRGGGGDKLTSLEQAKLKHAELEEVLREKNIQMELARLVGKGPENIRKAEEEVIMAKYNLDTFLQANPGVLWLGYRGFKDAVGGF